MNGGDWLSGANDHGKMVKVGLSMAVEDGSPPFDLVDTCEKLSYEWLSGNATSVASSRTHSTSDSTLSTASPHSRRKRATASAVEMRPRSVAPPAACAYCFCARAKTEAASYQKLLAQRTKEAKERRSESLAKKRAQSAASN